MAKAADKLTLELFEKVRAKKAEIALIERPAWKTNCSFSYAEGVQNGAVNLHVLNNLNKLVDIAGFLMERASWFTRAAHEIGVVSQNMPFTWGGYTLDDWLYDLSARVNQIQITLKKDALNSLETRLNAVISPELKQQLELEAIKAEVG